MNNRKPLKLAGPPQLISHVQDDPFSWSKSGRNLYLLNGQDLENLRSLSPARRPVCLVATERVEPLLAMSRALTRLLRLGTSYVCFFAPNATALHLEADGIIIMTKDRRGRNLDEQRGVVCTVGEDGERLSESAWFFMNCAWPPRTSRFDYLIVVWGSPKFRDRVVRAVRRAHA